jgi:hypothetical protein
VATSSRTTAGMARDSVATQYDLNLERYFGRKTTAAPDERSRAERQTSTKYLAPLQAVAARAQIVSKTRPMRVLRVSPLCQPMCPLAQNTPQMRGILLVGATGIEPVTSAVSKLLGLFQRAPMNGRLGKNLQVRAAFSPFIAFHWFAAFFTVTCTRCAREPETTLDAGAQI